MQFTLTTDAVAPYVYLANLDYDGIFSDNGFLAMPQKTYDITFTPLPDSETVNIEYFQQSLAIRYTQQLWLDTQFRTLPGYNYATDILILWVRYLNLMIGQFAKFCN